MNSLSGPTWRALAAAATAGVLWFVVGGHLSVASEPVWRLRAGDPEIVARGGEIYAEYCASCHGASLQGEPDWQQRKPDGRLPAPPHDASGHTWHHIDKVLFEITKVGPAKLIGDPSYESDMPAFEGVLSDAEIVAVLSFIKSQWPDQVIARHNAANEQAESE